MQDIGDKGGDAGYEGTVRENPGGRQLFDK